MRTVGIEACVALGFLALAMLDGLWFIASAPAWALTVVARILGPRRGGAAGWLFVTVGGVVLASGGLGGLLSLENAVVGGLVLLQVQRRLTRRGPMDDRVAVVLAGLMLVVSAGRTTDMAFLALAVGWALALPLALLPAGRRTSPGAAHLLMGGAVHVVASVGFFLLLPRGGAPAGTPTPETKLVGFAPDVELGALDGLLDDPTVVFRAEVDGALPARIYWRGLALDGFDGRRWYSTTPPAPIVTGPVDGVRVQITPSGPSDGVLFAPGPVLHVEAPEVRGDAQGGWFVPAARSTEPYTLVVEPRTRGAAWFSEPRADPRAWLALPAVDARIPALADRVAGEGSATERAGRLRDWLASEVTYTRSAGDHGPDPLASFLLERREGHCEYVAAGLTLLLRSEGIPARVVNGFLGGEVDPATGSIVVRRKHAHSWTEVLLDGRWVLLDATPDQAAPPSPAPQPLAASAKALWEDGVLGYDREAQKVSLTRGLAVVRGLFARPLQALLLLGLVVLGGLVLGLAIRRMWRGRLPAAVRRAPTGFSGPLQRAELALKAAGVEPPPAAPPVERARWVRGRVPEPAADAFEALAWLHYEVVFGGEAAGSAKARARALANAVEAALTSEPTKAG